MNRLKKLAIAAILAVGVPQVALAEEEKKKLIPGDLTFTATLASDYRFRGISQTDKNFAAQVGIDYAYMFKPEIGVYAGVWGSNVDFDDGDQASIEIDIYGGIKGTVWEKLSYQVGFIQYMYPKATVNGDHYHYTEIAGKLTYDFDFVAVTGGLNYSPNYFFKTGDGVFIYGEVAVPLKFIPGPIEFTLNGHLGHQSIQRNSRFGTPDYLEWLVGIAGKIDGFTLSVSYVDTNLKKSECFAGSGLTKTCGAGVVAAVSKTF